MGNDVGRPEGGTLQQKVINENRQPIKVNPEYTPVSVRYKPVPNDLKKFRCVMCGHEWTTQQGNFLSGGKSPLWKANGGYLPFCKSCCESLMENMTSFYGGNEEHALRHLCQIFDWYYDEAASAMTLAQVHKGNSRVNLYPSKMCTRQVAQRGETFLDTLRDEYESAQVIKSESDIEDDLVDDEDDGFTVTREMVRTWGTGFTKEQYRFLEDEYNDWKTRNVCNTKSQEEIYRNIALAQLDIRTARTRGGKVSEAQKALQDLMNSANILPKQTADNIIADTQTFGTLLKKYEETDPLPEPDERWRDVDNIRKYMNTWFRGGLAKALKINGSDNARLYEEALEEFEKYTVHPEKRSAGVQAPDSSIFEGFKEAESDDGS